jgi:hypothetical protein
LLPTLTSLRTKLLAVTLTLKLATALANAVLAGLNSRFEGYDTRNDLILATVTLPQFRLRWLEDDQRKARGRSLLHEELRLLQQQK